MPSPLMISRAPYARSVPGYGTPLASATPRGLDSSHSPSPMLNSPRNVASGSPPADPSASWRASVPMRVLTLFWSDGTPAYSGGAARQPVSGAIAVDMLVPPFGDEAAYARRVDFTLR